MQAWARLVEAGVRIPRGATERARNTGMAGVGPHGTTNGHANHRVAIVAVLQVDATAAQWPNQTPGIPRRADGKVDPTAARAAGG